MNLVQKTILATSCVALLLLPGCYSRPYGNAIWCTPKAEMTAERQEQLWHEAKLLLTTIANEDVTTLFAHSHPETKRQMTEREARSFFTMVKAMHALNLLDRATLVDLLEVTIRPVREQALPVPCTIHDHGEKKVTLLAFPGVNTTIMAIVKLPGAELDHRAYLYFVENEGELQWVSYNISAFSNNGKDAQHYFDLGKEWAKSGQQYPASVALITAQYLASTGPNMGTPLFEGIRQERTKFDNPNRLFGQELRLTLADKEFEIFDVGVVEGELGLVHYFKYVSPNEIGAQVTPDEAKQLFDYLLQTFPAIRQEYDGFLFEAFADYPADPRKHYESFALTFDQQGVLQKKATP